MRCSPYTCLKNALVKALIEAAQKVWTEFFGRPRTTAKQRVHRGKPQLRHGLTGTFSGILKKRRQEAFASAQELSSNRSMLETAETAKRKAGSMWSESMEKEVAFNVKKRQRHFLDSLSAGHLVEAEYTGVDAEHAKVWGGANLLNARQGQTRNRLLLCLQRES